MARPSLLDAAAATAGAAAVLLYGDNKVGYHNVRK
jgi:hypothetical protein